MNDHRQVALSRFQEMISPFDGAWRSLRYFAMAAQLDGQWIAIAVQFVLSEKARTEEFELVHLTADSIVCSGDLPVDSLSTLLPKVVVEGRIQNSFVNPSDPGGPYDLQVGWEERNFAEPRVYRAATASMYDLQTPCVVFERNAGRLAEMLRPDLLREADVKVPLHAPRYKDLAHLFAAHMPGFRPDLYMQGGQMVQFLAVLPFEMQYWNDDQFFTVTAPTTLLSLRAKAVAHVGDGNVTCVPSKLEPVDGHMSVWRIPIAWPQGSRRGTAKLYFDDEYVDELEFQRWKDTVNLRVVGDNYFDPEHQKLREALESTNNNKSEYAIVRLLNLLGIPAVWYGHGYDRSDALAVFQEWDGRTVALLIECTRQKPSAKFTPLLSRSRDLRQQMQDDAEVLPTVFVTSEASSADFSQAELDGILLADARTIKSLLDLINREPSPHDVMETLRAIRFPIPNRTSMFR